MKKVIYDIEVSPNRAMVGFMDCKTHKVKQFQHDESKKIRKYINGKTLVGFNSLNYDNVMLTQMLQGANIKDIYAISVDLVEGNGKRWEYPNEVTSSIDIMEVAQGKASLKMYGARLNTKRLQDLPYSPHVKLSKKQWKEVCEYNINDLILTKELFDYLKPQLNLRENIGKQYGINVMSRSDAQVAEDIFKAELSKVGVDAKKNKNPPSVISYTAPSYIKFERDDLQALTGKLQGTNIEVNLNSGSPIMPEWIGKTHVVIGNTTYNIGLGGLHSMEKSTTFIPKKDEFLGNIDIASMYPNLIINMKLYPLHLTPEFLKIYSKIRDTRLTAKKAGNKVVADTLKIVLNGSYGKFGSIYSFLYAPNLMLQVTFTGQLALLMLIERLELAGIKVVSANTDGLEMIYSNLKLVKKIVGVWEKETNLIMEYGEYSSLHSRDVNSYIAVYDGYVKSKGFYGEPSLAKNNEYPIVTRAIREHLLTGVSIVSVIESCTEPSDFCVSRAVTGGALWSPITYRNSDEYEAFIIKFNDGGKDNKALRKRNEKYQTAFVLAKEDKWYIGKAVRYYYSVDGKPMYYKKSGYRVPKSDGCIPMMQLTKKLPKDLDYDKYIELAHTHLKELGL